MRATKKMRRQKILPLGRRNKDGKFWWRQKYSSTAVMAVAGLDVGIAFIVMISLLL